MRKLFSPNGAFTKKAVIVGVALAVVVALSYFGSSDYLGQSIMDMLMGGTGEWCNGDCIGEASGVGATLRVYYRMIMTTPKINSMKGAMMDPEIRSLVALLNEVPCIQTHASCSGHPQMPAREWRDGWISMRPIGDPCALWDFLDYLRARLDNTLGAKLLILYPEQRYPHVEYSDEVLELYRKVKGKELYDSSIPIFTTYLTFTLCPFITHFDEALRIRIWEKIIVAVQEFTHNSKDSCMTINTPKTAAALLVEHLRYIPHIQSIILLQDNYNRWRVKFWAMGDRNSCQCCWDLVNHVHATLSREEEFRPHADGRPKFLACGLFVLRPIVKNRDIERTREDHMKIWELIELATREYISAEKEE